MALLSRDSRCGGGSPNWAGDIPSSRFWAGGRGSRVEERQDLLIFKNRKTSISMTRNGASEEKAVTVDRCIQKLKDDANKCRGVYSKASLKKEEHRSGLKPPSERRRSSSPNRIYSK
jgi:hypothetical protein